MSSLAQAPTSPSPSEINPDGRLGQILRETEGVVKSEFVHRVSTYFGLNERTFEDVVDRRADMGLDALMLGAIQYAERHGATAPAEPIDRVALCGVIAGRAGIADLDPRTVSEYTFADLSSSLQRQKVLSTVLEMLNRDTYQNVTYTPDTAVAVARRDIPCFPDSLVAELGWKGDKAQLLEASSIRDLSRLLMA